jgi:aminopeptidase
VLRGPNVDLTLSIKGRTFINSIGHFNMPDGEIFTGPVEDSVNGWVRFTYPAINNGVAVEGAELTFNKGRVETAKAEKNQDYLLRCEDRPRLAVPGRLRSEPRHPRFTGNILFDEKIGGSFHMALGAGCPDQAREQVAITGT